VCGREVKTPPILSGRMVGLAAPAGVTGVGVLWTNRAGRFILHQLIFFYLLCIGLVQTTDFRTVPYESLFPSLAQFSKTGVNHFTEIVFNVQKYEVIVGAEGALFRLTLDNLREMETAKWDADDQQKEQCEYKGQPEELCKNFIKVLLFHQNQVFACGTNAFNPKCTWRDPSRLSTVTQQMNGVGRCPYSPKDNTTALMSKDGSIFVGTALDPQSQKTAILRMAGHDSGAKSIRTPEAYDSKWLAQPDFVAQFETDKYVYFIYREAAVEYMNCGKAIYSRIARVCKNDKGGSSLLKDKWTTFIKARMNCSLPGDFPFHFDFVQDAVYVEKEKIVYAVFTTGPNSIPGSAVCNFNLTELERVFSGAFKHQSGPAAVWGPESNNNNEHLECRREATTNDLLTSKKYQLMDEAVHSSKVGPVINEDNQIYGKIAVDTVFIKSQDRQPVHVIFITTAAGAIKKISYNPTTGQTCLVEELFPFPPNYPKIIRRLMLLDFTASLYMTTDEGVIKIPVQRCDRFGTRKQCLSAMDPYCGWNEQKQKCTKAPNKNPHSTSWEQVPISCPILTDPIDGGWSQWSDWKRCELESQPTRVNNKPEHCFCKERSCNTPSPEFGGSECFGSNRLVTNCTQHGQWTTWSEWSGCSQTCGVGIKTRKRTCGNPERAFGGNPCIGRDWDEQYCEDLPKCSSHRASSLFDQPAATPTWSQWSDWTECSTECGKGFKSRERKCYGSGCQGCDHDWEECGNEGCDDYVEVTDWTPWINETGGDRGGWVEKRFAFTHHSPSNLKELGKIEEEKRYCYTAGTCRMIGPSKGRIPPIEDFSEWSSCSSLCGGGKQFKFNLCNNTTECKGTKLIEQNCNTHPCVGAWGCWSDFSDCKNGVRSRERSCQNPSGGEGVAECSIGESTEEMPCETRQGVWANWGQCQQGSQTRERLRDDGGKDTEIKHCGPSPSGGWPIPRHSDETSMGKLAGAFVIGLLVGCCISAALVYLFFKYKKPKSVTTPHYISAKSQNLYVPLPMLDLKHNQINKNDSDYVSSTIRSNNGTIRSKSGNNIYSTGSKGGDYETATIKRSHSRRDSSIGNGGHNIRADLDSDQMFT